MQRLFSLLGLALMFGPAATAGEPARTRLYVGTYTGKTSKGIYLFDMDPATGKLTSVGLAAETPSTFAPVMVPGSTATAPHHTTWTMMAIGDRRAVQFFFGLDGINVWLVLLTTLLMVIGPNHVTWVDRH